MRSSFRIGDVFEMALSAGTVGFFQYAATDETQLGSAVIRAFARTQFPQTAPDMNSIVAGQVSFHAHVFLKAGLTLGIWRKVGNAPAPTRIDVLFRNSGDYGRPETTVSHDWYVWRINEPQRRVARLLQEFHTAEIGVVKAPQEIAARMLTGSYAGIYPGY